MEIKIVISDRMVGFVKRNTTRRRMAIWVLCGASVPLALYAADALITFQPHSVISSEDVNANFSSLDERIAVYEDNVSVDNDSGFVRIDTTDPGKRLTVNGSLLLDYAENNTDTIQTPAGQDLRLLFGTPGYPQYGQVGVKYSVGGGGYAQIDYGGAGTVQYDPYGSSWRMGYSGIAFNNSGGYDGANPMSFTSDTGFNFTGGNVGIGTTAPAELLQVQSSGNNRASLRLDTGDHGAGAVTSALFAEDGTVAWAVGHESSTGEFRIAYQDATLASNTRLSIGTSGNVGIGTTNSPYQMSVATSGAAGLSVSAVGSGVGSPMMDLNDHGRGVEMILSSWDESTPGGYLATYSNHPLMFATHAGAGPTAEMTINNGNVGIGTTTPEYTLDVAGYVRADNVSVSSDARLKKDIAPLEHGLEGIECLQGVTYTLADPDATQDVQIGLIAQEVEACYPELVSTDAKGYKSVAYDRLVAPLIEAVKDQQVSIAEQQRAYAEQQRVISAQEKSLLEQQRKTRDLSAELAATNARLARLEALIPASR